VQVERSGLALVALAPLLAACLDDGVEPVVPARPATETDVWGPEAGAAPWAVMSWGCGFCSGSEDFPEFYLIALYDDGRLLSLSYGHSGESEPLSVKDGLEAWIPVLDPLFLDGRPYATSDGQGGRRPMLVHTVDARTLEGRDWTGVRAVMSSGLDRGGASSGEITFTDCGPDVLEGEADPPRAERGCGVKAAGGWDLVARQLEVLADWM
jgi:hypothetical protein